MIGLVSSTLFPSAKPTLEGARSAFSPDERIAQTRQTLESLRRAGIERIFVADNSDASHASRANEALPGAQVLSLPCHPFPNRGLNELILLLSALPSVPAGEPVLKISGRYRLAPSFSLPEWNGARAIFKGYDFQSSRGRVSTRCYAVKERDLLEPLLELALTELFVRPYRVVGPRSFARALAGADPTDPRLGPTTSIEFAMACALKRGRLPVRIVDGAIGLEGEVAGVPTRDPVSE